MPVLTKLSLPTSAELDAEKVLSAVKHDKNAKGDFVTCVYVDEIGKFEFKDIDVASLKSDIGILTERSNRN